MNPLENCPYCCSDDILDDFPRELVEGPLPFDAMKCLFCGATWEVWPDDEIPDEVED